MLTLMPTPSVESRAQAIKTARLARGISIREAARYLYISPRTMARIETGQRLPSPTEAKYLADFLNLDAAKLMAS